MDKNNCPILEENEKCWRRKYLEKYDDYQQKSVSLHQTSQGSATL
jgi:hypothetical protein